jgi:HD-GYP domain-containing protein (c-di-GMP phosphodiesterase class II)
MHPEWGWTAIRNVDDFRRASLVILHHHERLDGRGYPGNLRGTEIPLGSRIIAVADSYDALTSDRPYRKGRSTDEAVKEIIRCSGTQFDEQIVKAFCESLSRRELETSTQVNALK